MNDLVTKLLAKLFDTFKAKNPKIAAIIIILLAMLITGFDNGLASVLGLDNNIAIKVGEWLALIWLGLQGSRTSNILRKTDKV